MRKIWETEAKMMAVPKLAISVWLLEMREENRARRHAFMISNVIDLQPFRCVYRLKRFIIPISHIILIR